MADKAISVRAPWWWFIFYGGKDIENRPKPTKFRGTVYIHASKFWRPKIIQADARHAQNIANTTERRSIWLPISYWNAERLCGHIIGTVDIVDCVTKSDSPWFSGPYGYVLENPKMLDLAIPCKGMLGFFDVTEVVNAAKQQVR